MIGYTKTKCEQTQKTNNDRLHKDEMRTNTKDESERKLITANKCCLCVLFDVSCVHNTQVLCNDRGLNKLIFYSIA